MPGCEESLQPFVPPWGLGLGCRRAVNLFFDYMAGELVALGVNGEGLRRIAQALDGQGAARVEAAARWRGDRRRNVSLQHDALLLESGIGLGHGGQQRLGVGMERVGEEL